ncbi:PBSX family phage terminase large subunit [Lactiplantibacillus plantarum]|uniref:PBSX family phage terminase large subunit n=1 Tax=Lactiplantibacillus plantarum TaxID=1590 RepID=UPI0030A95602
MEKTIQLTPKQNKVIKEITNKQPRITILSGGKRGGKTFLAILLFLMHVQKFRNHNVDFIIGGATISTIQRNVLNVLTKDYNINTNLNKNNGFQFCGNNIYCIGGDNASSWKMARGFTAYGAYMNEGTALHQSFIQEVMNRCSGDGAKIIIDTNPENPNHPLKTDLIDHSGELISGQRIPNVLAFSFTMDDNTTLSPEYIQSNKQATPKGYLYDRDILGKWVGAEGMVYKEYDPDVHVQPSPNSFERYVYGVDWGFRHRGAIVVCGVNGNRYQIVRVIAKDDLLIDDWVKFGQQVKYEYGNYPFYCDTAMPAYIAQYQSNGLNALNGNKNVNAGIEYVDRLLYQKLLTIAPAAQEAIESEIYSYVWNGKTSQVVKANDDVMDAMRYAIYTDYMLKDETEHLAYRQQEQLLMMKGII